MIESENDPITRLLNAPSGSDPSDAKELFKLVYGQLRKVAQQRMAEERTDHTLSATALVHEAYLRLVGNSEVSWSGRGHFYTAAAEAMRRILVEHARAKGRLKRGGGRERVPLGVLDLAADQNSEEILALDEAVCRLEREDPEVARVVQLRFFAGLSIDETAKAIGVSPRQVDRLWEYARAWLYRELHESQSP